MDEDLINGIRDASDNAFDHRKHDDLPESTVLESQSIVIVLAVFLLAGAVKGIIGLGLPSISLGLLTIAFDLPTAMALLIAPSVVTNLIQSTTGGHGTRLLTSLWPFFLSAALSIVLGALLFQLANKDALAILLGSLLSLYGILSLLNYRLPASIISNQRFAFGVGTTNGILTGLTGSFVVPGVMYLQALALPRDAFVQSMGILFSVSTLMLGICLAVSGLLSIEMTLGSLVGVIPAVLGMIIGQHWRKKLSDGQFRLTFFYAILVLGMFIVVRTVTVH